MQYIIEIDKPAGDTPQNHARRMQNRDGLISEFAGFAAVKVLEARPNEPTLTVEFPESLEPVIRQKLPRVTIGYHPAATG